MQEIAPEFNVPGNAPQESNLPGRKLHLVFLFAAAALLCASLAYGASSLVPHRVMVMWDSKVFAIMVERSD